MTARAHINPQMLLWARNRADLSVGEVAHALQVPSGRITAWEGGATEPTFRQAQKFAQVVHAPFGYFFLQEPPAEDLPVPDLRTVANAPVPRPSVDLLDTVRSAIQRQAWYAEFLADQGAANPLPFIGRFNTGSPVREVAEDIRAVLSAEVEFGQRAWNVYFRDLIRAAEDAGILVMRSGTVGNNTHRKLDVAEFRGFALSHPFAPVIFINSADAPAARLFTLIHELAHLWIGSSGISNAAPGNTRREESFCNAVAGEFLVPEHVFTPLWHRHREELPVRAAELAQRFHVSRLVIVRRALDLGFIDHASYLTHYRAELRAFRDQESGQGSFYRNAGAKNSPRFAKAVVNEALSGRLLLRDAGKLLDVAPDKIKTFGETLAE